jgi:predicted HTH domain antitoxin
MKQRFINITKIIEEGLDAWKMNKALGMYRAQKVTLWKAAEIAGVTLAEMLAELPKRGTVFQYDLDELREDLEYARSE